MTVDGEEILIPTKIYRKTIRGNYKAYNDNRYILKGTVMIKKITAVIKHNQKDFRKRALVLGGTALGAFVAGVVLTKAEQPVEGVVLMEEEVTVDEETTTEDPTTES